MFRDACHDILDNDGHEGYQEHDHDIIFSTMLSKSRTFLFVFDSPLSLRIYPRKIILKSRSKMKSYIFEFVHQERM